MHRRKILLTLAAVGSVAAAALPASASAAPGGNNSSRGAVFVQTNTSTGNSVVGYDRLRNGKLVPTGEWATGGVGGLAVGAPFDALASQGSLVHDEAHGLLLAVNAGSDTITSFGIAGAQLSRRQVLPSGGDFPVSVAVSGDLVYVLNTGGSANVSGFRIAADGTLAPLPGSTRELGITNSSPPNFLRSPGQVGFSPDGSSLYVPTKLGGTLVGFGVQPDGRLRSAAVTALPGAVPFSFTFDRRGRMVLTTAAEGRVKTFDLLAGGAVRPLDTSAPDGGSALCWNVASRHFVYGANSGSSTLAAWKIDPKGRISQLGGVGAPVATGDGAPLDLSVTSDDDYLYALNPLTGSVQGWLVNNDGSLSQVERVGGLPVFDAAVGGPEGLVAT